MAANYTVKNAFKTQILLDARMILPASEQLTLIFLGQAPILGQCVHSERSVHIRYGWINGLNITPASMGVTTMWLWLLLFGFWWPCIS